MMDENTLFLSLGVFLVGFVVGRAYEKTAVERHKAKAEYAALSNEDKLIRKIEENMYVGQIRQLLSIARLDAVRASDGVTPIIAATRWVRENKNYQNRTRRYQVVFEISRRLPRDRFLATLNAPDHRGWTALMYAAEQADSIGGGLLIHLGADPSIRNPEGKTAADIASRWPTAVDVFKGRSTVPSHSKWLKDVQRGF
jgi:ankyrin repeat protein